ncbi:MULTISPECIES: cytochrome P450 [unclassified Streptomyces]|uniref:cytochrome P450 n=1 Tax=unclassified Streptomyces TaxID=2593676 RepID=UPI0006999D73|nr:cytochrome P450 [Streptomyces sp. CNQ-509]
MCVADPETAVQVLRDNGRRYEEVTEFLRPRGGRLADPVTQVAVGRAARRVLRARLAGRENLFAQVVAGLGEDSRWPHAGHVMVHDALADVLLHPDSSPRLRHLMARCVRRHDVLIRSSNPLARVPQHLLRARLNRAVAEEVRIRRRADSATGALPAAPKDLLEAVRTATPADTDALEIAGAYVQLFRTSVAPVAHVVAWALLLAAHAGVDLAAVRPDRAVREALRLWPVAWLLTRTVRLPHEVAGAAVAPGETVAVCVYLLHRNEDVWPEASRFRPDRWAHATARGAYLPFGAGPRACTGGSIALDVATALVAALSHGSRLVVHGGSARPRVQGIITPPDFRLDRRATTASSAQAVVSSDDGR